MTRKPLGEGGLALRRAMMILLGVTFALGGCVTMGAGRDAAVIRAKERVAPALVHIKPVKEVFTSGKREEVAVVGSGFIVSGDGYVVTNEHVAGESRFVRCVLWNKEEVEAEVVGTDPFTDIAILKLQADSDALPYVELGDSGKIEAGQTVLALGSPHGLARSVSLGIVSVSDRYLGDGSRTISPYNTWIQTDAAINQGNSGGPLVNLRGQVVGINTRKLGLADNIGFAIPINIAKEVMAAIIEGGRVQRSWLGLNLQPMTAKTSDPEQRGVVVGDVDPLSPAFEAGIRAGDTLTAIDGLSTDARFEEDLPAVRKLIAGIPVGSEIAIELMRGGEPVSLSLTTAEKSDLTGKEVAFDEWGFTAAGVTPTVARAAQLDSVEGVLVIGAQVGGVAANARMRKGDIILEVDDLSIDTMETFQQAYRERIDSGQQLVLLRVKRGALTRFVLVNQGEDASGEPAIVDIEGGNEDDE